MPVGASNGPAAGSIAVHRQGHVQPDQCLRSHAATTLPPRPTWRALDLYRRLGHQHGHANALRDLGKLQQQAGDHPAALASHQQALQMFRDLGARPGQARALNDLGTSQQLAGDYPAAVTSHQQALELYRDLGSRLGLAEAHNNLGQLATRTADTQLARRHHIQALAIAQDIGVPLETARALEGIGQSDLADAIPGQAAEHLRQALVIYLRIGAPAARRVQQTLQNHKLASPTPGGPASSTPEQLRPSACLRPLHPHEADRQAAAGRHAPSRDRDRTA